MKQYQTKKEKEKFNIYFNKKQTKNLTNFINKYYLTSSQLRKLVTSDWVIWEERYFNNDAPTKVISKLKIYGKYYIIESRQWLGDKGMKFIFVNNIRRG